MKQSIHVRLICLSLILMYLINHPTSAQVEQTIHTRHLDKDNKPLFTNQLLNQSSYYLQQHAHNPVEWLPWGEEAFAEAKKQDKPIFLSIGYSTCHWCHVMARESFEDLTVADFINNNFIAIKVDREEHPDIDEIYLTAVQMLSGKAGWPLNAVLTPDGTPFFGGTYFPPDQLLSLLSRVSNAWNDQRPAVLEQAGRIQTALAKTNKTSADAKTITLDVINGAEQTIIQSFAAEPSRSGARFPREPEMQFLLHQVRNKFGSASISAILERLDELASSGIHDHLAGGFHRYSVDSLWTIPHFEKMLYNQAQLARLYSQAYMISDASSMRDTAESTFDFMLRDMQSPEGGFYSAIDAESEGVEGAFYLWSAQQIKTVLNEAEFDLAKSIFDITESGDLNGSNILRVATASASGTINETESIKEKLSSARSQRIHPMTDKKIITAWNGLSISALITGHQAFGKKEYLDAALSTAQLIWNDAYNSKTGLKRTLTSDDKLNEGTLEDYAYFTNALLDIYDQNNEQRWLERSIELANQMVARFHDKDSGGFRISSKSNQKKLIVSLISARDDEIASGNSIATQVLARLYRRTGNSEYKEAANSVLSYFSNQLLANPESLSGMLIASSYLKQGESDQTLYGGLGNVRVTSNFINGKLSIEVGLSADWHINSYRVLQSNLVPTALIARDSACPTITDVVYPKDSLVRLGFQEDELLLYENDVIIEAQISKTTIPHCNMLMAELKIQACSDEICLLPESLQVRAPLLP